MKISRIFRWICNKVWNPSEIESLRDDVVVSLALVEMHFPPSFINIMTHLLYHLVDKLDLCGLVATRWMYPIERYMKTLKTYVWNMVRLEGSIVERYIRTWMPRFHNRIFAKIWGYAIAIWDGKEGKGDAGEVLEGAGHKFFMSLALCDPPICNNQH